MRLTDNALKSVVFLGHASDREENAAWSMVSLQIVRDAHAVRTATLKLRFVSRCWTAHDDDAETVEDCLDEVRKLIAEAVPEQDEMRRTALLALADH